MSNIPDSVRARVLAEFKDTDECWEWPYSRSRGYGTLRAHWQGHNYRVHRVAWEIMNGPIPEGMYICHHCDNPPCFNPAHLFAGTPTDNNRDMWAKGRARPVIPNLNQFKPGENGGMLGESHGNSKFTNEQVREIKRLLAEGGRGTCATLARRFGVNFSTINRIKRGQRWQHLE